MSLEASVYWSIYQVPCFAHNNVLMVRSGDSHVILECIICSGPYFHLSPFFILSLAVLLLFLTFYFSHQSPHSFTSSLFTFSTHIPLSTIFITYLVSFHSLFGPLCYLPIDMSLYFCRL